MRALVTGATGFIGGALARRLHATGWEVTASGRNENALDQLRAEGLATACAELQDAEAIVRLCRGQDVVFHCGGRASDWGSPSLFNESNVIGTRNVVSGCLEQHVGRLVHVSTPSLYFDFARPRLNVKETDALPARPINEYARTKRLAEQEVMQGVEQGLSPVMIRPSAVFGPGDRTILPRIIDRLRRGVLPIIGSRDSIIDLTYVENLVNALILAAQAPREATGRAYNITNGEPVRIWDLVMRLCDQLRLHRPRRRVPYRLADAAASAMEITYRTFRPNVEPPLTRYSVARVGMSSSLDITAARQDLGYEPRVPLQQALDITLAHLQASA